MKKIQKNSKGMTLVEVIVAITIFAIMSIGIMTALGAAMLQTNRSARRDIEVGEQAETVGKKSLTGLTNITGTDDYSITFSGGGVASRTVNDIKLYQADSAQFGAAFGFNIKTFGKLGDMNGFDTPDPIPGSATYDAYEYKIELKNTSSNSITMYVELTNGYIYEGNRVNGYIHNSKAYTKTSNPSAVTSTINFGYYNDMFSTGDISIHFVTDSNKTYGVYIIDPSTSFTNNKLTFTYDGTNVTLS